MKPKSLPSVPPADSDGKGGVGPEKNDNWDKAWTSKMREGNDAVREGSPSIKLGLGIGGGSGELSHVIKQGKPTFTLVQFQELHLQSLIFRYIVAGLPVPMSLVLPIWKSVASLFGYADGGIYDQYPSFVGFSSQGFDYKSMMDPEPGRCKRTDGKKWRCSWNVVPDQKYCERHMHRGRQRSRKHVEALEFASETDKSTTINSSNVDKTNTNHSIPVPVNLQLTTPSPDIGNNTPTATITSISGINASKCNVNINEGTASSTSINLHANNETKYKINVNKDAATTSANTNAAGNNRNSSSCGGNKDQSCKYIIDNNNINRSSNHRNNGNSGSIVSLGFGFSPRSVLQGGTIISCSNPCFDYRDAKEPELQRCRRTDGKKWQCSRDVIPGQKYCGRHMHRGAKKLVVDPYQVTVASAAPSNSTHTTPLAVPKRAGDYINLNTNLSISILASPLPTINGEMSGNSSSSSSDATTISDEFSSASHRLLLSPH